MKSVPELEARYFPDYVAPDASLAALPFPDGTFDLVISRSVFEHLTDPSFTLPPIAGVAYGRLVERFEVLKDLRSNIIGVLRATAAPARVARAGRF